MKEDQVIDKDKNNVSDENIDQEKNIDDFLSTEIEWVPFNNIKIIAEKKDDTVKFLESLEDDEDVQNVFTNLKI